MKNIGKALLEAQKEFLPIEKDTQAFKYKYAPLDKVLECIRPALSKHGIVILQPSSITEGGFNDQKTILLHVESGETIVSSMELQCDTGPQDRGSEVTYLRRYTLLNATGCFPVDEDDDGKSAQESTKKVVKKKQEVKKEKEVKSKEEEVKKDEGDDSENGVVTAYRVFLDDCNTIDELKTFWRKNQEELKKLENNQSEIYQQVFSLFSEKKRSISQ